VSARCWSLSHAGLSNQEIADALHMGYGTVKTHVSHLLTKLECRDRASW
jgi:DNA-binding NarL/FixJ family response regulator